MGLERGPLSLVGTVEELFERESSGSDLEIREYGRRDPSRWPRSTIYPQNSSLTSPTSGGRSVGIVHSRTQATEFSFLYLYVLQTLRIPHFLLFILTWRTELFALFAFGIISEQMGLHSQLARLFGREISPMPGPLTSQQKNRNRNYEEKTPCLELDSSSRS
jgi:hypothetical protein